MTDEVRRADEPTDVVPKLLVDDTQDKIPTERCPPGGDVPSVIVPRQSGIRLSAKEEEVVADLTRDPRAETG